MKTKLLRFLNPLRKIQNKIYSFILAAYLGKIIITLNEIDHIILDWVFYFLVYSPMGKDIKEFYKVVGSRMMGVKLNWLKELYKGNDRTIKRDVASLKVIPTVKILVGHKNIKRMIRIL